MPPKTDAFPTPRLPKGHILWETHLQGGAVVAVVTSDSARQHYYLYRVAPDGSLTKAATAKYPTFKSNTPNRKEVDAP